MSPWNGRCRVVVVGGRERRVGELRSGCGILTVTLPRGGMVVVAERERTVGELQFLGNKSPTGMVGIWTW